MVVLEDVSSKTLEDVIDLMIGRGSTVTKATLNTFTTRTVIPATGSSPSGNIAQIRGSRLKFDISDPAQGIYLIAADGVVFNRNYTRSII